MRNAPAVWSVLLGVLATAALPAAVWYADRDTSVELIWAGVAVPAAIFLGLGAIAAGRAGRRRAERTVQRSGAGAARAGRFLGLIGMLIGWTGAIALLVYAILSYRGRT